MYNYLCYLHVAPWGWLFLIPVNSVHVFSDLTNAGNGPLSAFVLSNCAHYLRWTEITDKAVDNLEAVSLAATDTNKQT